MRYTDSLKPYLDGQGRLNDFLELRDGRLIFGGELDLLELTRQYGAPLEIAFCPLITRRVHEMQAHFTAALQRTGYRGGFVYAYATKANFSEEVIRTAIGAGAHYETSSGFDVRIAQRLWEQGLLPADRFIFCNGSKDQTYLDAILAVRRAGFANIVPILDDPEEFEALAACPDPLLVGVRERKDPEDLAEGSGYGYDRFGMLPDQLEVLARRIAGTPHRLIVYHAMVGSQCEEQDIFIRELIESLAGYARLRAYAPELTYFNFGGGMPTRAYSLSFNFDYTAFAEQLMHAIGGWADAHDLPHPHLVGEFGRYTVADHGAHIFQVGRIKAGHPGAPPWYLVDGSLMVALPDILIVKGQQFIVLALNHFEAQAGPVVLGGRRTCDSDDFYPRTGDPPVILPHAGAGLLLAFFGTGAYQAMLSGEGGAHHCLAPEAPKLIFEAQAGEPAALSRINPAQQWTDVLEDLGYR